MKILIIGVGVIGVTYGWKLRKFGHDITFLVRTGKLPFYSQQGLEIQCFDARSSKNKVYHEIFMPHFVDQIHQDADYDLIIVAVNRHQMISTLSLLKAIAGKILIMFFLNNWKIQEELSGEIDPENYVIGFPFIVGGGRNGNVIESSILKNPISATMLGEVNGKITPRIKEIFEILKKANLKPKLSKKIIPWLVTHYIWAASLVGAWMQVGSTEAFCTNSELIKKSYLALREGYKLLKKQHLNPRCVPTARLFYFPLIILVPFTKKLYSSESMKILIDGHIAHSPEEMKIMFYEVLGEAQKYDLKMPNYEQFEPNVTNYLKSLSNV